MKKKSSEEIKHLISQLREQISDVFPSNETFDNDFYLYRWLTLHDMKVDETENVIRKSIEWRQTVNLKELADREWAFFAPGLEKEIVVHFDGISKNGQPVCSSNGEGIDSRALVQKYGKESLIRYFFQFFAKIEKRLLEEYKKGPQMNHSDIIDNDNENVSSRNNNAKNNEFQPEYNPSWDSSALILIVSYNKFSIWNATCVDAVQGFIEGAKAGMSYFPAAVNQIYVVNLNKFSSLVLKLIKPIIASDTFNIDVFDTDKSKWSKKLLEEISSDQLQIYFGGKLPLPK